MRLSGRVQCTDHLGIRKEQTREMIKEIRGLKLDRDNEENHVHQETKQLDNSEKKVIVLAKVAFEL